MPETGLGDPQATLRIYLNNRPAAGHFSSPETILPLAVGDIAFIVAETGNHWRKIFNVFAKLMWELTPQLAEDYASWQAYRDQALLQKNSQVALCFGPPGEERASGQRIFMGKQFATDSGFFSTPGAQWLDNSFAINDAGDIVSPYFDYRQLSDEKIRRLTGILNRS